MSASHERQTCEQQTCALHSHLPLFVQSCETELCASVCGLRMVQHAHCVGGVAGCAVRSQLFLPGHRLAAWPAGAMTCIAHAPQLGDVYIAYIGLFGVLYVPGRHPPARQRSSTYLKCSSTQLASEHLVGVW